LSCQTRILFKNWMICKKFRLFLNKGVENKTIQTQLEFGTLLTPFLNDTF